MRNYLVILHRFQISESENMGADVKIRQVWCTPMRIIALENMYFRNLLSRVSDFNSRVINPVYTSGFRNVEISELMVRRLRNRIGSSKNCALFSMDYSKYDRTIPDFAIDLFFSVCRHEMSLNENEFKMLNLLRYYIKYSPIIYKSELFFKRRGISSGSLLTNLFDSFWNLTIWELSYSIFESGYYEQFMNNPNDLMTTSLSDNLKIGNSRRDNICVCGDDVIIYCEPEVVHICIELCKLFDMNIEVKMSTNHPDKDIFFLGRYWDNNSAPFQTEFYIVLHAIFRTRFYKKENLPNIDISSQLTANRLISICCQFKNGYNILIKLFGTHPQIIDFFSNRRRFYKLGDWRSDDLEFKKFDEIYSWKNF